MRRILLLLTLALLGGWAVAHPIDELVQASYLSLSPDALELELNLTPGAQVAAPMMQLVDTDRDGLLTQAEVERYAANVLSELRLSVDGRAVNLELARVTKPQTSAFVAGGGTVQIIARAALPGGAGRHVLEFENLHAPVKSGYLSNGFAQSDSIQLFSQTRNDDQSAYRLEYGRASGGGGYATYLALALALAIGMTASGVWWTRRRRVGEVSRA
ncbi:MAG: hypothetical protein SFU83_08040 [Meiothermus sp.]|nr:hypothetical protein [Meiothermus sp.]